MFGFQIRSGGFRRHGPYETCGSGRYFRIAAGQGQQDAFVLRQTARGRFSLFGRS
jgi:hypothetical protein